MKENKARGPDNISLRLLKYARKELIPSLLFLYIKSAARNSVPASWKKLKFPPCSRRMVKLTNRTIDQFAYYVSQEN